MDSEQYYTTSHENDDKKIAEDHHFSGKCAQCNTLTIIMIVLIFAWIFGFLNTMIWIVMVCWALWELKKFILKTFM